MGKNQQNGFTTELEMKNKITQSQATDELQQVIREPQMAREQTLRERKSHMM